jgi:rhodanese-related sulfurtransferase
LGILAVLLVSAFFFNRGGTATADGLPREISVSEASAMREEGAFVLDVREPEEWNESHIPDTTLIPLGELASRVDELPQDQEIVVVCRSGNRSAQGRDLLLSAGFTQVTSMAGGVNQWKAAGFETVSGP